MSRSNLGLVLCLTLICWFAAVVPASAQHFKQIPGTLNYISAGRAEVWGIECLEAFCIKSAIYRFNSSTQKFVEIPGAPALDQIVVGGGTLLQKDEVWGYDDFNNVYRFNFGKNAFVKVPGTLLFQIAVGEGFEDSCHPYEVWGDWGPNVANPGTFRYNYCTSKFDAVPLPVGPAGPIPIAQIAVSGAGDIWAISEPGGGTTAWEYFGSQWGFPGLSFGSGAEVQQIAPSVMDLWGVFAGGVGDVDSTNIESPNAGSVTQIATGWEGVWVIYNTSSANGVIARFDFQRGGSYYNDGFSNVPGLASPAAQIAVGSGAGVWAIDSSRRVYAFVRP